MTFNYKNLKEGELKLGGVDMALETKKWKNFTNLPDDDKKAYIAAALGIEQEAVKIVDGYPTVEKNIIPRNWTSGTKILKKQFAKNPII